MELEDKNYKDCSSYTIEEIMATSKKRPNHDIRLKRFLYTSNEDPRYITGNAERHSSYEAIKVPSVHEFLFSKTPETLLNIIEIVNSENLLARRETIFFVLAVAACTEISDCLKNKVYTTLSNVIKSIEDLCLFIKLYTKQQRKFSSGINRVISTYYNKKDPLVLVEEVSKSNGYHSWTHKDLIKLSHCKSDSILTSIILVYILYGLPKAKSFAEENPDANVIIEHLTKVDELKRCEKEERIIELIKELHCNVNRVPSFYHHSQQIWEALIPELQLSELIAYLPKLYKFGFLKANSSFQAKVVAALTNIEKVEMSKIHPVEVFIGLRNFEKGGKPLDPQFLKYLEKTSEDKLKEDPNFKKPPLTREAPKCPNIISALYKAMQISYKNPEITGRRIMITIDVSERMEAACLHNKNLTCLDAAVILALSLHKVEREVIIAVFNNHKVSIVPFDKNISFNQAVTKLKQARNGYVMHSAVFEWAIYKKKQFDFFINILYYHHWCRLIPKEYRSKEKPLESLKNYRKKMSLPHTKFVTFSLGSPQLSVADGTPGVLDICGFTKEVPKVIQAFGKGSFV